MKLQNLLFVSIAIVALEVFGFIRCKSLTSVKYVSHKNCNGVAKGTFIANPGNCSQYIECNGLRSTLGECPEGSFFNEEVLSCDKSRHACKTKLRSISKKETQEQVEKKHIKQDGVASISSSTTRPHTRTPRTAATTIRPITLTSEVSSYRRPVCLASSHGEQKSPHPTNCQYFYYCIRGLLSLRQCHFGFGWDVISQRCSPLQEAICFQR